MTTRLDPIDMAACRALLKGGSRTFNAASKVLPRRVAEPAIALYAFCRLADDAVDLGDDRASAVARLRDRLDRAYQRLPMDRAADRLFAEIVAKFCIPRELPEALLEGLAWDAEVRRYETLQDLTAYAARVAGAVGAMMTLIMGRGAPPPGAAPSYFRASGRYLDGGLMGNNPTLDALTELAELGLALRGTGRGELAAACGLKIVVSCGTGQIPVTPVKDFDVFKPESLWDTARLAWGLSALGSLLVDQATQADGRVVERARAWCGAAGVPYYRFSPPMSRDVSMDERSDERLVCMLWEAQAYMRDHRDEVAELAALLADAGENDK